MVRAIAVAFAACSVLIAGCRPAYESARIIATGADIIPRPVRVESSQGTFRLQATTPVIVQAGAEGADSVGRYFIRTLAAAGGMELSLVTRTAVADTDNAVVLSLEGSLRTGLGDEGYMLSVTPRQAKISAAAPAGLFYGIQTLRQLLPPDAFSSVPLQGVLWSIPCVRIEDVPRFPWRGMHLDVSRHFFGKAFIKEYLDLMAMHKLNVFHWHLTDDNGWRLEIKRYPRLTSIGAWRVDREQDNWQKRQSQQPGEKATYGGYYTQDDVREILAYAKERYITVVPEIEMPGHSVAAVSAYPEYSCTGGPFTVLPGGYWPNVDIYCAGNEGTFTFLEGILTEVTDLFPSPYVHIGGDEADKTNWKKCPKCQDRIKGEGLKNEEELQSYFIRRIEIILNARGKRLIGWDEILQGGLPPNATVMSWQGMGGGIAAAKAGHDVVMTPTSTCYFDYYQAKSGEPEGIGGFLPLDSVYRFEPVPDDISPGQRPHILGTQANLWTEYVPTASHAEYMVLPRMCALAEVAWTMPELKDFDDFLSRLEKQYSRFDRMGVNYRGRTVRSARP